MEMDALVLENVVLLKEHVRVTLDEAARARRMSQFQLD